MHLQACMEHINNYFVPEKAEKKTYTIAGGVISPSFDALEGQRFLICMSGMNDGVYTYHANGIKNDDDTEVAGLCDETFAGTIRVCSVPPAVLALSREKSQWEATHSGELGRLYEQPDGRIRGSVRAPGQNPGGRSGWRI